MSQTPLWVTIVGFLIGPAVTVAVLTFFFNRRLNKEKAALDESVQKRLNDQKSALDRSVQEHLNRQNAALSESAKEQDARRDYAYDARKRLYEVTEPLFFQLAERAEDLAGRIVGLARCARQGDLEPADGWLSGDGYYLRTTIHRLVAPVAIFHLLQDRMTLVDLRLDEETRIQYWMAKQLAWTITDAYSFAKCEPEPLPYKPQEEHPNQGLPSGVLEAAGQSVIVAGGDSPARVMRFGEFDAAFSKNGSAVNQACLPFLGMLLNFHPRTHPVLWRILVTQSHLCAAFIHRQDRRAGADRGARVEPWTTIPPERRGDYDWRQNGETAGDREVLTVPFEVARNYLESRYLSPRRRGALP
ncbi:hypothetical protein ACIBSW_29370 [Actinoplanes sp. NPDC049668]|uniref:hypothetical protein n=1 Tax=unclassified Actinoplanes TaxID=2626549 RepID=UPI0033A51B60